MERQLRSQIKNVEKRVGQSCDRNVRSLIPAIDEIVEVKDLLDFTDFAIQGSTGNGFCYHRFCRDLGTKEYLAYSGYAGNWTDNKFYYARRMMLNTQFHRSALELLEITKLNLFT